MKHIHKFLSIVGNIAMVVLLVGLVALPASSFGLLNVADKSGSNKGMVLSTQDVRIKIDPAEIKAGRYFYNESTGKIEKRKFNSLQNPLIEKMKEVSETTNAEKVDF